MRHSLIAGLAALTTMAAAEQDYAPFDGLEFIGPARPQGPIHRRGRFKPNARQEAKRLAKRAGKRRQQGRK